jgi:DNA-binding NtrC family response regulator
MDEMAPRTKLRPRPARVIGRLAVRVVDGPDAGLVHHSGDEPSIAIGAAIHNDLVLSDPTVSRYHMEITLTGKGVSIEDLGSRNGTFVGAVRVERAEVPARTRIKVGATTLVIEDADRSAAAVASELPVIPGLVGDSDAMADVGARVAKLALVTSSVLIQGETGAGKEVVARSIHDCSDRAGQPFVVVDCGSMPATLIASQLFGHERGAFTGADRQRIGAFERARGGTVLLDEIGELPLELQPVLLGVLERRKYERVGGSDELIADVRVLAATNRDLRAEVNKGTFRPDLYYRLAVARIVVPPLRERPDDIELLVAHFVDQLRGETGEPALPPEVMNALRHHHWSGNVRELRNVVEGWLAMGELELDGGRTLREVTRAGDIVQYRAARAEAISRFEREYLEDLISRCEGNASEAARRAKMDRPYLLTLLRKHGLR